jgi:Flp pilus assembly pilin Flp
MKLFFSRLIREDGGQDLVEYAFLAVFILLAAAIGLQQIGTSINTKFGNIATTISTGS